MTNANPKNVRKFVVRAYNQAHKFKHLVTGRLRGLRSPSVNYVVDGSPWSTRHDGVSIIGFLKEADAHYPGRVVTDASHLFNQVVHFGSLWVFFYQFSRMHRSNKAVVTIFHGHPSLGQEFGPAFEALKRHLWRVQGVVTSTSLMRERLLEFGVPAEKLHVIPIGVDTRRFHAASAEDKARRRKELGIPDNAFCIGSFQKDGMGWGDGMEPKLIKGPDVFLEVVRRVHAQRPVFVLLTGPARGYVIDGLKKAGIPFQHGYLQDVDELPRYYHCLDAYLMASREEGGPKSILESMACGVPLVATKVGMVGDVVRHEENGLVYPTEDCEGLAQGLLRLASDQVLSGHLVSNGLQSVAVFDWRLVAQRYHDEVYSPLLLARGFRDAMRRSTRP